VCTHAREIDSGQAVLKTCNPASTAPALLASLDALLPRPAALETAVARQPLPEHAPPALVPAPPVDVPTPPPLA